MRTFSKTLMLFLGFLAFTACDADSLDSSTTADGDDDFGFTTSLSFHTDSKRYNPTSGNDE